jgi:Ni/Co efflux regulator RcnB
MKRLLIGVLTLTMAGSSLAMADPMGGHGNRGDQGDRHDNRGDRGGDHGDRGGDRHDNNGVGDGNGGGRDHNRGEHRGWGRDYGAGHHYRRGQRMGYSDWRSAQRVPDYRRRHLRAPPRGYEWRRTRDGQYILAAVATGVILSIILSNR